MSKQMQSKVAVDASQFQQPLCELAETIAQKALREGCARLGRNSLVPYDLFVLIRQAKWTYTFLCYINADERREHDCYWYSAFTFVAAPLIRTIIDCLYNITFVLQDPPKNGAWFRRSGFKKELQDLEEDAKRYKGRAEWNEYLTEKRAALEFSLRRDGFNIQEVLQEKTWNTLGRYLSQAKEGKLNPHQQFLKTFTHGMWREYSAMGHGAFEGLLESAAYYTRDAQAEEVQSQIDERYIEWMSLHLTRASIVLLCIVTEMQAYFSFDGANINSRIHKIWDSLLPTFEAKELYEEHYSNLMKAARITPL